MFSVHRSGDTRCELQSYCNATSNNRAHIRQTHAGGDSQTDVPQKGGIKEIL